MSSWHTTPITLGIKGETTFQCFARVTALSIIGKDSIRFAVVFALFGDSDIDKVENRLAKAVDRLRKKLQEIPELEIVNIPQQGYRAFIKLNQTSIQFAL